MPELRAGTGEQGRRVEDFLRNLPTGSEVVLRGTFLCGLHLHPKRRRVLTLFAIPDRTRVIVPAGSAVIFGRFPGEPPIRNPANGRPDGTYCDLIASVETQATGVDLVVDGRIDGQPSLHDSDQWWHGIRLWGASDCSIGGSGELVGLSNGISGGGGPSETFAWDFPGGRRGPCRVWGRGEGLERFEWHHGRSTGGSQNAGAGTAQGELTVDRCYGHNMGAHGLTSWKADGLVVTRSEFAHNGGSGARREHGDRHEDAGVYLHHNARGLNLLDCSYRGSVRVEDNGTHGVQLNAVRSAELAGTVSRTSSTVHTKGEVVRTDTAGPSALVVDELRRV